MKSNEAALLEDLAARHGEMLELLERLVNIDSGSYNKRGVDAVCALLRSHLQMNGLICEMFPNRGAGDVMRAVATGSHDSGDSGHVLLMGHCDTVFPDGTAAARSFHVEGDRGFGPGVADMKSGLVMNTFVLEAVARHGAPRRLVGLYTSDEEIASSASRPVIEATARGARAVFNAEPGRANGNLVVGRKGTAFIRFEVTGKAAHSGVDHRHGVSAIEALARKVQRLHALTDYATGTTANVGLVRGGVSINTVAPSACAEVDVRYRTLETMNDALERARQICLAQELPGSQARITDEKFFLPMAENGDSRKLLGLYARGAAEIGFNVDGQFTGGSADSGFTSSLGVPTLCATGPVGGNFHCDDEYCCLNTLVPRAQALALAILRLAD